MTPATMAWGYDHITAADVAEKRVIEVGAYDVNGSFRRIVELYRPASYLGIDLTPGPGVDVVCPADEAPMLFGEFDLVICTEVMEHVPDWVGFVNALKTLTRIGGVLVVTTRSPGFPFHEWPVDCWRYTEQDAARIFADMEIENIEPDPEHPGVFVRARRTHSAILTPNLILAPAG